MKKFCCILILCLGFFSLSAQQAGENFSMESVIKSPPSPARLVNDYTTTLTSDQRQALENKLVQLDDSTSTQIAVVIVPSLGGYDVADAATELGTNWGVGGKKNNGVVLLICTDKDNRKLNISPGYGLEGALTDVEARHIIQDIIVPNFKGDDYYRGIDEGTDAIIKAVKGEYNAPREKRSSGGKGFGAGFIIIIIILVLIFGKGGRGGGGSGFLTGMLLSSLGSGGRSSGGWGGGGSSGGGGGFGGFGGGSFGGGGASGSW